MEEDFGTVMGYLRLADGKDVGKARGFEIENVTVNRWVWSVCCSVMDREYDTRL